MPPPTPTPDVVPPADPLADRSATYADAGHTVGVRAAGLPGLRRFAFHTDAPRVDGLHTHDGTRAVDERSDDPYLDAAAPLLDGLFALALAEARENAVETICDAAFQDGRPIPLAAYETGAKWHYVWTRDLAYAVDLGLAGLDPDRCAASLMFKTSGPKAGVAGGDQVLQDTGSGGSYPVSTDRVVWAIAADRLVRHLPPAARAEFVAAAYPLLKNTAEQDRQLVFDPADGLYRGEQSFLDWREQTYPLWTAADTMAIALSKATNTNVAHVALLRTAARFAAEAGDPAGATRYAEWEAALIVAINKHLWDDDAGLYAAYLLTESRWAVRVKRYDLLGQSLAILWGVASPAQARRMLDGYPSGPHGPPVAWPQEQAVPIYHNHAIWPFVTAYWARAAAVAGRGHAVGLALHSLVRGAAVNLSNMENLDLATGHVHATVHGITGPVISSQRQLWSVAGFVSVVRDTLFGLDVTAAGGVAFRPCLTPAVRRRYLGPGDTAALRNLTHLGHRLDVVLHLPEDGAAAAPDEPYAVARLLHNGDPVDGPVPPAALAAVNRWDVWLAPAPPRDTPARVPVVAGFSSVRSYFGPLQPEWLDAGVTPNADGHPTLRFASAGPAPVTYTVYRDGHVAAADLTTGQWTDPAPTAPHDYAVAAVFPDTGLQSHLSPERSTAATTELPATDPLTIHAAHDGPHVLRLRYANDGAPINTGITCGVARWTLTADGDTDPTAAGHVLFPHTGPAALLSSPMVAHMTAGRSYRLCLTEDAVSRNMSHFAHNRLYTAHAGGGDAPHNRWTVTGLSVSPRPPTSG